MTEHAKVAATVILLLTAGCSEDAPPAAFHFQDRVVVAAKGNFYDGSHGTVQTRIYQYYYVRLDGKDYDLPFSAAELEKAE